MRIAAVVIFYNPEDSDINNINYYIDEVDSLYVVDNSKYSNEHKIIKNKKIKYIFNNGNLGIAKPLNQIARLARKNGYEWLLTLDQDTIYPKKILGVIKSRIEKVDTTNIGIITPWHKTKLKLEKPKDKISNPLDVMTSGNLVNLKIHEELGGFKEWLFIDGIDIEYCLNLKKNKYSILRYNDLEINHNLGDIYYRNFLGKELLITNHNAIRRYYQSRNYRYIRDMYINIDKEFCKRLVKFKSILLAILLFENNKFSKILLYIRGYIDYKLGKKGKMDND